MNQTFFSKWLYVLLLFMLVACQAQATPPIPAAVPPTAVPPTVASTQAGTVFTSSVFRVPLTLTYGSDWAIDSDTSDQLVVQDNNTDFFVSFMLVDAAKLYDPTDGHVISFPKDFLAWIKSNPDFSKIESMPVTVGGIPGTQIDAEPTTTSKKSFIMLKTGGWNFISVSDHIEHWRFIDLGEVKGQRLLILSIAPADQFQSLVPESQKILDTVVFGEP
jgi:hypothetical protein